VEGLLAPPSGPGAPPAPEAVASRLKQDAAGMATHADYSPVSAEKPARPGEKLLLFVPGLGKVDSVKVMFDGKPGAVAAAGVVPNVGGLCQVTVTVPADLGAGSVSVTVTTPDALSDVLEIEVAR
jgi:uncharacterized protein (TIGR03437 family)